MAAVAKKFKKTSTEPIVIKASCLFEKECIEIECPPPVRRAAEEDPSFWKVLVPIPKVSLISLHPASIIVRMEKNVSNTLVALNNTENNVFIVFLPSSTLRVGTKSMGNLQEWKLALVLTKSI